MLGAVVCVLGVVLVFKLLEAVPGELVSSTALIPLGLSYYSFRCAHLLIEELKKSPATLRLSYLADVEAAGLVDQRLAETKREIVEAWDAQGRYELTIESQVFWRRGAPPSRPDDQKRDVW